MKPRIEWQGKWADGAYRKSMIRKATSYEIWANRGVWDPDVEQASLSNLTMTKREALKRCKGNRLCVLAFNPFPPETIAIVYPGDE